jgi:hypothetical protein
MLRMHKRIACLVLCLFASATLSTSAADEIKGEDVFQRIVAKAQALDWSGQPMRRLMQSVAMELEGTPYVAGTLELSADQELPSVDLRGLDCVTFFETTLDISRMLRKGGSTPADLMREIKLTRYRGGKPGDYTTRLHYTTDWFFDNQAKKVVSILPGTMPFPKTVNFMSTHPDLYPALKANPKFVATMKNIEKAINLQNKSLTYVPNDALGDFQKTLQTGDIVGIVTDIPGLDISHTGLVIVDEKNVPHFMDASSRTDVNKVILESPTLAESIRTNKHSLGAIFARPLEP